MDHIGQSCGTICSCSSRLSSWLSPRSNPALSRSERGESVKLVNKVTDRTLNELIVLGEQPAEGDLFYQIRTAFSGETGYPAEDTIPAHLRLAESAVMRWQWCHPPSRKSPDEESPTAQESHHAARILGSYKNFSYVITEDGNMGYVKPDQLKQIDAATLEQYLSSGSTPAQRARLTLKTRFPMPSGRHRPHRQRT